MWQAILAALLSLQAPGKSIYSQVVVHEGAPAPCADSYSLLCLPPKWSEAHRGYTRAETWAEGLARYVTIAHALDIVVYQQKRSSPRDHLWRYVAAMIYHESGLRRDVHEGVGDAARGDCDWRGTEGKRERVPGSCKSHCLAQILLGPTRSNVKTAEGHTPLDLVGTDLDSTVRCLEVAARVIDGALHWCSRWGGGHVSTCVVGRYAGGMIASRDPRVLARVKTVNALWSAPTQLEKEVLLELGFLPEGEEPSGPVAIR